MALMSFTRQRHVENAAIEILLGQFRHFVVFLFGDDLGINLRQLAALDAVRATIVAEHMSTK
jgi:hypothetical protein